MLLRAWDSIGVSDEPEDANEYNAYVGGVYRRLASGASAEEIAAHLSGVETEHLGIEGTDPQTLIPVAYKLQDVYARFERPANDVPLNFRAHCLQNVTV